MMIAAETEMFKLSVKPTIGIFRKPSARCKISPVNYNISLNKQ
jgi:hypothetical protein